MKIGSVSDLEFKPYGKVLDGYDFSELLSILKKTPCPADRVLYVLSEDEFEKLPVAKELEERFYGGMPIQIGYCNGHNGTLNCLEYHRDSEVDIFGTDAVLLLASESELEEGMISSSCVKAFRVPAGTAVELFATTLHYAPCTENFKSCFQTVIVLPRGTNTKRPKAEIKSAEDRLLWARNKWLVAHPDSAEAKEGAAVGIFGENLCLWKSNAGTRK